MFGNFYRHLYTVLPRKEFGFLHNAFEEFVVEDWKGLVRGQHRLFAPLTRKNSQWMSAQQAETTMHVNSKRLAALVRNRELEGIFVKTGRQHTECWIRRESLNVWSAKREADLARYMSCPEAKRALGLKHETLLKVAQAGLVRYVSGAERSFRSNGIYFLREDVSKIKHAFEKHAAHVQPYTGPGKLIALRHALKNYLGRDSGLPAAIRAVVDGRLVPVGYTKRFPGITGYLFPSEDLRKYHPVQTEMPPGGFLNFKEAASALGTRNEVIRGLVSQGILSTPNEYRVGLSKLVPAGEVQHFAEEYVDASILAESSNETIHWVKRALRESGVPFLEISVPEKGTKAFPSQGHCGNGPHSPAMRATTEPCTLRVQNGALKGSSLLSGLPYRNRATHLRQHPPCDPKAQPSDARPQPTKHQSHLRPHDLLEYRAKAISLGGVDHLNKVHAALKMRTKVWTRLPILAIGAKPHAVGEYRL